MKARAVFEKNLYFNEENNPFLNIL